LRTWGEEQTVRYLEDLEKCCHQLAANPGLGRACDHIRSGLRRMEHGRHVIFYRIQATGMVISRILHQPYAAGAAEHRRLVRVAELKPPGSLESSRASLLYFDTG